MHTFLLVNPIFVQKLNILASVRDSFDSLLQNLSKLYKKVRDEKKSALNDVAFLQSGSQNRNTLTMRYWVHPDNVMELKLYILKNIPILVNTKNNKTNLCVSTVYYDNKKLGLYKDIIEKVDGAEEIRLRWIESNDDSGVIIQRNVFSNNNGKLQRKKQEIATKGKYVNSFISGEYTPERKFFKPNEGSKAFMNEIKENSEIQASILETINSRNLIPGILIFPPQIQRSSFGIFGDASVKMSLDTDVCMIREDNFDGNERAGLDWKRVDVRNEYPFPNLPERDICRFPYAILKIKVSVVMGLNPPLWVNSLINCNLVEPVPNFSKYVHGVSALLDNRVHLHPPWVRCSISKKK
ncbi:Vacuolar transporter chaperone 4 [Smittium mucronatum]|uniref:Vacuolar transporter chaperone 4 n=1 Tax=Smittium mucronatum TaxID=133383 RepID=A0A1R0H7P5_9FUNG|nr:Vacuolar transporter chaperone 4 [Smittium mucronatum]